MGETGAGRFRFGLYEFDAATRKLRREGVLIRMQAQPAQVLGCLIARAGQVVSREDLREALWHGDTFVDFDRGLNFCISQVRSALKDDSAEPTYIRTIPKQGYQFIAPLERIGASAGQAQYQQSPASRTQTRKMGIFLAAFAFIAIAIVAVYWLRNRQVAAQSTIVAVLRFDNETGDPDITRFTDGLTDNVVEQLTSASNGKYSVIGNARILRLPREQRDLTAIATSLHADYVVLGQVQSNGPEVRILIHLIHLPDQTHVWVARMDRTLADPLSLESEAARKVAAEFSPRVIAGARSFTSLPSATP
jgi:DNA-binding winged helix-turn-helix (wHTH) protein/TolB-like protein